MQRSPADKVRPRVSACEPVGPVILSRKSAADSLLARAQLQQLHQLHENTEVVIYRDGIKKAKAIAAVVRGNRLPMETAEAPRLCLNSAGSAVYLPTGNTR